MSAAAAALLLLPPDLLLLVCAHLSLRTRLCHLARACKQLRSIVLRSVTSLPRLEPALPVERLPNLRALKLSRSPASFPCAHQITDLAISFPSEADATRFTNLTRLAFFPGPTHALLTANAPHLRSLRTSSPESDPNLPSVALPPLPALASLHVSCRSLTHLDKRFAGCFSTLTRLSISSCHVDPPRPHRTSARSS